MSRKIKELSKELVERVRQCVIAAGGEFDGVQTSFTALPQVIFQTVDGPGHVYSVEFDPATCNDQILIQALENEIAQFRASQFRREKMTLKEKLWSIYQAIDMIDKRGENSSQHYDYVKAADVTRELRAQFIAQRIYAEINFDFVGGPFTIARAREKDAPFSAVMVKCSIVFHDLDSAEILTGSGLGTGADTGDKAAYKAQTGAMKYALKNAALVPDEADPEADETVDEGSSVQASEIPDFQDAKRGAAPKQAAPKPAAPKQTAPAQDENPFDSQPSAASSTKSQVSPAPAPAAAAPSTTSVAPDAEPEHGDAYEGPDGGDRLPTEEELTVYRAQYSTFSKDIAQKGKLTASKGLTAPKKLNAFLLHITKAKAAKFVTKAQWDDFFDRVAKATARENGFIDLAKLINKVNGIEEKK